MHHPAELPEVLRLPDGSLIAHWLELTGAGPWADSLYFSRSTDDGRNWSQPEIVHGDRSPCGHGLASIAVSGPHNASVFWLNDSPGGSTQLKTADIHSNGQLGGEQVLDSDTCSCCPTTVVKTAKGLLAAYRGRTPGEIRDISLVDNYAGRWSAPRLLHRDHWRITACPVNGASLSADGRNVVIAWYTGAQDDPRVEAAFSSDSGQTFDPPLRITSERVTGHISVTLLPDGHALIAWVENAGTTAQLLVREVTKDGFQSKATVVASGTVRGLGYPRLQSAAGRTMLTWVDDRSPKRVVTAWIGTTRSTPSRSKGQ